ncbi:probable nucleoredoxin 3 isoform X3 [Cynara cardunculus var. scolymus]|uniref:probable nucleoredoxin 3 isoform X3 n=1 Tax=Cynara cardunculus var. scolymus TaxID=59895 RepID=UPI000D62CD15|nr:probable nucleoredoxin 3 isoform X3 [Cynara cardunculus var. scolymus]
MSGAMGGAGCESAVDEVCNHGFTTILAQEGIHQLLSGEQKVPLPSGEDKMICLLFSANWSRPCKAFIPQLVQAYNVLKDTSRELEVIFVSFDRDENGFKEHSKTMPWLVVPFDVKLQKILGNLYKVNQIPSFIPLGVDPKVLAKDAVGLIKDYGADAFPFTKKSHEELKAIDEAKRQGGKLDELFNGTKNSFISNKGVKIHPSELVGQTIGLYFGAHWCPPCRDFTTQLVEAYNDIIKNANQEFEVIFISTDRDHKEFDLSLTKMPWLAIPFDDKSRQDLCRIFEIKWIPSLILLGPDGRTISTNGRAMISLYGARGFPFTEPKILEIEASLTMEGDGLRQEVKDCKHEHILKLEMPKAYICDFCKKRGTFWAFSCDVCGYDLHPTCIEETL